VFLLLDLKAPFDAQVVTGGGTLSVPYGLGVPCTTNFGNTHFIEIGSLRASRCGRGVLVYEAKYITATRTVKMTARIFWDEVIRGAGAGFPGGR
jgi:hypothetical protein